MLFIINFILAIIGVVLLFLIVFDDISKTKIFSFVIVVCMFFAICVIGCKLCVSPTEWRIDWQTNIIALKDSSNIQGDINCGIFVVSGQIGEETYYYCMESTNEGSHIIKIPVDRTYIIETSDCTTGVIKKSEYWKNCKLDFWLCPKTSEKYYIYVPAGTIDTTFRIDME